MLTDRTTAVRKFLFHNCSHFIGIAEGSFWGGQLTRKKFAV